MPAIYMMSEQASAEVTGRQMDSLLDNNYNFPATESQASAIVMLGGRIDPTLEGVRVKGGIQAAMNNRPITTDERVLAPFNHMFWDRMKRGDRWVSGGSLLLTNLPSGELEPYDY
eukprot:jgi/Mesvir1/10831/Mv03535-RA.1